MYIERHMVKQIGRQTDKKIFFSVHLSASFAHVLDKNMEPLPDFLAFYNIGLCTTGAPNNCSSVSHLICFCGYSQSKNNFPLSLHKFYIHLN